MKTRIYFECGRCYEKIDVGTITDKQKLKMIAEKHFRDKHKAQLIKHELITVN